MVCQHVLVLRSEDADIINANKNDMIFNKNKEFSLDSRKKYKVRLINAVIPVINNGVAINAEYVEVRCSLGRPYVVDNKDNPCISILINQSKSSAQANILGCDSRQLYNFSWTIQANDLDRIHVQYFDLRTGNALTKVGDVALEDSILWFCFSEIDD